MIEVKAFVNNDGVDVHSEANGSLTDVMEESVAIVEALYENIGKANKEAQQAFLSVIGQLVVEWVDDVVPQAMKGGDLYA